MAEKLLIVGIDPGTTLGYALLDIDGNLVKVSSSKQLDLNSLIFEIVSSGTPLFIGTDRKDVPQFIAKLGRKLGARVITSEKDMPVPYKRTLTKEFEKKYSNDHEMDALAGAVYALKKFKPLIDKIDRFLEKGKKQHLRKDLIGMVLKNDLSIKFALEILESPDNEEVKIAKKAIDERKFDPEFLKLYERFKQSKREIQLMKGQNEKLKKQLKAAENKIKYITKKVGQLNPDEKAQEQLSFKENTIQAMAKELQIKTEEIECLSNEIFRLNNLISEIGEMVLVKKIKNLGIDEYENKNRILKIKKRDILLVENLDIISQKTVDLIKKKVDVIIYKGNLNKRLQEDFLLINAAKFGLKEEKYFALIDKSQFETEKLGTKLLSKILEDYKKQRS